MLKLEHIFALLGALSPVAPHTQRRVELPAHWSTAVRTPAQAAAELIAADRAFATGAANKNVIDAIGALVAPDVVAPAPGGVLAKGRDSLLAILRRNPDNLASRLTWSPYRVGVSADGLHGFTYGWMTMTKPDSTRVPLKYLAYWVKGPAGWKAVAYKRVVRAAGPVPDDILPPIVPRAEVAPTTDQRVITGHATSLADAERAFSALAGKVGLGEAFRQNADVDAMNMGSPQNPLFLLGPDAIGQAVGGGSTGPSPLTWGPDEKVVVASSGDLGVTVGWINLPPQPSGGASASPAKIPFFTIWMRRGPDQPWKFVAE